MVQRRSAWLYVALLLLLGVTGLGFGLAAGYAKQEPPVLLPLPSRHAPVVYEDSQRLSSLKVMDDDGMRQPAPGHVPSRHGMALIMDDMGYNMDAVRRALALPYPVAISIIPNAPYARRAAELAHRSGHVVMLHLPMEPVNKWYGRHMDGAFLRSGMSRVELRRIMLADLARVPYAAGVNNHMGSRLTALKLPMRWVMDVCREKGLFFVDSRTSRKSVAAGQAREAGLIWGERRVFLDDSLDPDDLRASWRMAQGSLLHNGFVIIIAHPHPETLNFLEHQVKLADVRRMVSLERALVSAHATRLAAGRPSHAQ